MTEFLDKCNNYQLVDYLLFLEKRKMAPNVLNLQYFLTMEKRVANKQIEQGFDEIVIQKE